MKRILTLAIVALFTLNLNAQKIEKGIWQIEIGTGINTGFNWVTSGEYDYKETSNGTVISESDGDWSDFYNSESNLKFEVDATNFQDWEERFLKGVSIGYFVADGFLIGLSVDLFSEKDAIDDTIKLNEDGNFSLGITPKLRYYIPIKRGNAMFFETSFGAGIDNRTVYNDYQNGDWDEDINNSFGTTIGLGVGWSIFSFNSREIFAIEPMFGFNIGSGTTNSTYTSFNKAANIKYIDEEIDKGSSMGAYFKIKIAFYLGRHFWSH